MITDVVHLGRRSERGPIQLQVFSMVLENVNLGECETWRMGDSCLEECFLRGAF